MRAVKIVFWGLIGLMLIAAIVLAVFLVTFDVSHYKPRIIQELSSALSREVQIDQLRLDFALDKGLTIAVNGISVADDPSFSREKVIYADRVYLNTDILALVLRRQIAIARIEISGPRLYLVRNKEGVVNIQTLFANRAVDNQVGKILPETPPFDGAPVRTNGKGTAGTVIPQMSIHTVRIENGAVTFVDESVDPPLTVPLQQIDFQATQLSLEKPFPFESKAKLWADQQNIIADGQIEVDVKNNRLDLQKVKLDTDLSLLRLRAMPFYGVLKEQFLLEGDIEGKLALRELTLRVERGGLSAFSFDGELNGGRLSSELIKQPLEDIHARFHADQSNVALNELSVAHASGTLNGQGRWSDYGESNLLILDMQINGVQLGELISRASMPVLSDNGKPLEIGGGIYAAFDAEGHGKQTPELRQTLQGDATVEVRGGKLLNFNPLRFVIDKLSFIPDLAQKLEKNLPPRYKASLESEETVLDRVAATAKISDQALRFNSEVQAEGFDFIANGSLDFDQNLDLATPEFLIPAEFAASMIAAVPELSYLSDPSGKIAIPLKPYRGKLQDIRLYPDIEVMAAKVFQNRGQDELKKAIFRALDIDESTEPQQQKQEQSPADGQEIPQEDTRPEKILIDGIFDAIFKGNETP